MQLRFACLLGLGILAGCSDGSGPGDLELADLNGSWVFTLLRRPECPDVAIQGEFYANLDFVGDGSDGTTLSTWSNVTHDPDRYTLMGDVDLDSGAVELQFWSHELHTGFLVEGDVQADGTITGSATDPVPGYEPYLSVAGCLYDVSAERQGP